MSYECAECERDLRGGHDPNCSRYVPPRQTDADDLMELGGLSPDERDQLAADLQQEQEATTDADLLPNNSLTRKQSQAAVDRWYQPGNDVPDAIERHLEREHVTDGTPRGCEPSTIDPEIELGLEPDGGIDGTTGLPLRVEAPVINAGGGGLDPWLPGLLQPLNDQVFLVRVQPPDRTASGLAIPESAQSKGCECRVLAAGPGAKHARTGERIPMSVVTGDRVVIGKWQGNEVTIPDHVRAAWGIDDREPVIVVRETEILAVLVGGV